MQISYIVIEPSGIQNLGNYATLLVNRQDIPVLATLLDREYFFNRWSDGRLPLFRDEHLLSVQSMTLQSPLGIEGAAAAEVTRSLGDALSLGKQIQDIRTSSLVGADKNLSCGARKWNLRG